MSALRQALYSLALLGALGLLLWAQQQRLALATHQLQQAEQCSQRQHATIATLEGHLQRERSAQADLRRLHSQLRQGLAERERTIEALQRENQELRDWAAQPLPEPARRLRQRPALSGAAAYHQWLSSSGALSAPGNGTSR